MNWLWNNLRGRGSSKEDISIDELERKQDKALEDYILQRAYVIYHWFDGTYAYLEKEQRFYKKIGGSWIQTLSLPTGIVLQLLKMKSDEQKKILRNSSRNAGS